jgi:2-methylfumaryl-CoA hydratase
VLVRKRDPDAPAPEAVVPELPRAVSPERLVVPGGLRYADRPGRDRLAVLPRGLRGRRADRPRRRHGRAESEHRLATRLYQNTARVHFNDHVERQGRLGACIVYGGVVISLARALSFNGLGNALPCWRSTPGRTRTRALRATRSTLGRRFWTGRTSRAAATWAR